MQGLSCPFGAGSRTCSKSSHLLCWFQDFSDKFAFYSRGGERSDNSELPKGMPSLPFKTPIKSVLASVSPHPPGRGMFFLWEWQTGGDKAGQVGLSSYQVFPFESKHIFRTTVMGPKVFHLFSSFTSKKSSSFSHSESLKTYFGSHISHNTSYNNIYWWRKNQAGAICNRFLQNSTNTN